MVGGIILVLGLFSSYIKRRTWISEPMLALAAGIALGPAWLDVLDPRAWGETTVLLEEVARFTLAIGLMGVALRLPPGYVVAHRRTQGVLLGLLMPLMWLVCALLIYVLLDTPWLVALLVAAAITPTDPIVATSIVTGRVAEQYLPARMRHALSAESGFNDGLGQLFVMLAVLLVLHGDGAWGTWFGRTLLLEVVLGALLGGLFGWAAARLLHWAERLELIERTSFLAYTLALALLTLGVARLLQMDGIIAVFAAGAVFSALASGQERAAEESVQESVSQFFTLPIFAFMGLMLPWDAWAALGWPLVAATLAVLLLRRLPTILLLRPLLGGRWHVREVVFMGWFGPIGISALMYAMVVLHHTGLEQVWHIVSFVVVGSIVAHGMTATPFSKLYGRRAHHTKPPHHRRSPGAGKPPEDG
ncbi:cation:proton antiporter [Ectothiorhodospiraceae bacterium 2226]|nr:cation:proton antiporter [Ectothiorhodospiraceae bacterium 2226]